MKKVIFWFVCILLCVGLFGGTFALVRHIDGKESIEQSTDDAPDSSSTDSKAPSDSSDEGNSDEANDDTTEPTSVWMLCKDASDLKVGDQIVIVVQSEELAMSTVQNTSNRSYTSVEKDGDTIMIGEDVQVIVLEQGVVENTFAFNVGTGYLYAPSSASNMLKTHAAIDENSSWSIDIDASCVASIVAQGESTRNVLMYNSMSMLFSCYTSSTYQDPIVIYKLVEIQN